MLNRKYFPFERNHYYYGKLLTSKDFEAEQRYGNDKRRLLNRLTGANGILAGLGVILADDASVIVQAGCALDASGREIVVPETRVVKLTTIEGFGALETDRALVGIAYDEQPAERMYAAMGDAQEDEVFNKVQEKYRLTLLDEAKAAEVPSPLDGYLLTLTLYEDGECTITQALPRYFARGSDIAARVTFTRRGHGEAEYSLRYTLDAPGFLAAEGGQALKIAVSGLRLRGGETRVYSYPLTPQPHLWGSDGAVLTARDIHVRVGDEERPASNEAESLLRPTPGAYAEQFLRDCYGRAMDKQLAEVYDERLWLARLVLIRQGTGVVIDRVEPPPFGQYVYNAQQLMALRSLGDYYPPEARAAVSAPAARSAAAAHPAAAQRPGDMASGVFDLGLGLGYTAREAVFSDEIMHGLGKGTVYVDVGIEYIRADGPHGEASEVYLGDGTVFEQEDGPREGRARRVSAGVKVLPDRGTFVVGVRLGDPSGLISLRVRWYAWKLEEAARRAPGTGDGERYMLVRPDTVVVPPKGTAHITPVFLNMPPQPCRYSLVDARGGTIDNDGVYTAPSAEGVYEIRIEAIGDPEVFTHAFAVVSQKKKD